MEVQDQGADLRDRARGLQIRMWASIQERPTPDNETPDNELFFQMGCWPLRNDRWLAKTIPDLGEVNASEDHSGVI